MIARVMTAKVREPQAPELVRVSATAIRPARMGCEP